MANANRPMGLVPRYYLNGSQWNGMARTYSIAASYATALYIGDPVISSGTADTNGVPGIAIATGTTVSSGAIRGVIVGLGKTEGVAIGNISNLDLIYRPASDAAVWYARVVDDPNVLFEVQERTGATQIAAAEIGLNTVLYVGTGNGFVSGWMLSNVTDATPATTATLQVRLMGLIRRHDNAFGAYAKHLIKINVHELGTGTGAAGV